MHPASPGRSTAKARRATLVDQAIVTFAQGGWAGTTVADVAKAAGISTAYVLKLFPSKERLFVAALDECFARIEQILVEAATDTVGPAAALAAMGDAYTHLIADRSLLMLQVHAQSAAAVPAIGDALRAGLARAVTAVSTSSGADADAVQLFFARGQLCHLVVTAGVTEEDAPWARILGHGIRHYDDPEAGDG